MVLVPSVGASAKRSPTLQRPAGALNAFTQEVITITNTDYINSQSVCDLLHKIKALTPRLPITVVLDNARYQRCALVQNLAAALNIELLFLPPYSPEPQSH